MTVLFLHITSPTPALSIEALTLFLSWGGQSQPLYRCPPPSPPVAGICITADPPSHQPGLSSGSRAARDPGPLSAPNGIPVVSTVRERRVEAGADTRVDWGTGPRWCLPGAPALCGCRRRFGFSSGNERSGRGK